MKDELIFYGDIDTEILTIDLRLTLICNYKCSYCGQFDKTDNPNSHISEDNFNNLIEFIKTIPKTRSVHINLTGGEATTHPNFFNYTEELCKVLQRFKNSYLKLGTNLSQSKSFYFKYQDLMKKYNIQSKMFVSYHGERANLDRFLDLCFSLTDTSFTLCFMIEDSNSNKLFYETREKVKEYENIGIEYRPLLGSEFVDSSINYYSDEGFTKVLMNNGDYILEKDYNKIKSFRLFICLAYKYSLHITSDGFIEPCQTLTLKNYHLNETLKYSDLPDSHFCTAGTCLCNEENPKFYFKNIELLKDKTIANKVFGKTPGWFNI